MTLDIIENEFNKNSTLMSLLKKWHQESSIDEKDLYHVKSLYKENLDYIKNFKMSLKQFESFDDFYQKLSQKASPNAGGDEWLCSLFLRTHFLC